MAPPIRPTSEAERLRVLRKIDDFSEHDGHTLDLARDLGVGPDSVVLDVGCGGAGFLRAVGREFGHPARVGIDIDEMAINEAMLRTDLQRDPTLSLRQASSTQVPVETGSCTHVFCLNALTYMPLAATVEEFGRALVSGGILIVRTEQVWYDCARLGQARSVRDVAIRLRDLAYGFVSTTVGQPPRSRWWGNRAFLGQRRLRGILTRAGFEVIRVEPHPRLTFLGRSTQVTVGARRRDR